MRRTVLLLASLGALAALPAAPASADLRPLPEIPWQHCDPGPCPQPAEGLQDCVRNAVAAVIDAIEGTPQPRTCDPTGRTV